jgi:hypothetical protein
MGLFTPGGALPFRWNGTGARYETKLFGEDFDELYSLFESPQEINIIIIAKR